MRISFLTLVFLALIQGLSFAQQPDACDQCKIDSAPRCIRRCDSKFTKEDRSACLDECKSVACTEKCTATNPDSVPEYSPYSVTTTTHAPRNVEEACRVCLDRNHEQCKEGCREDKSQNSCIRTCKDRKCSNLCYLPDSMSTNTNQIEVDVRACDSCKSQAAQLCANSKRCKAGVPGFEACKFRCEREACKTACLYAD